MYLHHNSLALLMLDICSKLYHYSSTMNLTSYSWSPHLFHLYYRHHILTKLQAVLNSKACSFCSPLILLSTVIIEKMKRNILFDAPCALRQVKVVNHFKANMCVFIYVAFPQIKLDENISSSIMRLLPAKSPFLIVTALLIHSLTFGATSKKCGISGTDN